MKNCMINFPQQSDISDFTCCAYLIMDSKTDKILFRFRFHYGAREPENNFLALKIHKVGLGNDPQVSA
jgi:hypothetical protein